MKNNCVEREKIFALAQQMLSGREQQEVSAHLGTCEKCRGVLHGYQRVDSLLDEWSPPAEPSPWFDARLRAAVAREPRRPSLGFLGLDWSRSMAAPAMASLVLVAGLIVIRDARMADRSRPGSPAKAVAVVTAASGGTSTQAQTASQELKMYQNLPVLEDYDMLSNFDVISELPKGSRKLDD
jgi:predicted anti-sigma-YlaC factor YlaD